MKILWPSSSLPHPSPSLGPGGHGRPERAEGLGFPGSYYESLASSAFCKVSRAQRFPHPAAAGEVPVAGRQ